MKALSFPVVGELRSENGFDILRVDSEDTANSGQCHFSSRGVGGSTEPRCPEIQVAVTCSMIDST
jgi:hypothetical protein